MAVDVFDMWPVSSFFSSFTHSNDAMTFTIFGHPASEILYEKLIYFSHLYNVNDDGTCLNCDMRLQHVKPKPSSLRCITSYYFVIVIDTKPSTDFYFCTIAHPSNCQTELHAYWARQFEEKKEIIQTLSLSHTLCDHFLFLLMFYGHGLI